MAKSGRVEKRVNLVRILTRLKNYKGIKVVLYLGRGEALGYAEDYIFLAGVRFITKY